MFQICGSSAAWFIATNLYVKSSDYTIVSHSILFSNLGGIFIVGVNSVKCLPVHKLEIIGTIIVIISAIFFINDQESTKSERETDILLGDLIVISATPMYAVFFLINSALVIKIPSLIILHIECAIHAFTYFVYFMIFQGPQEFLTFHSIHG